MAPGSASPWAGCSACRSGSPRPGSSWRSSSLLFALVERSTGRVAPRDVGASRPCSPCCCSLSVLLHEIAHAATARALGLPVTEIVANLWGGHTQFE